MRLCRQVAVFALIVTLTAPWIAGAAPRPRERPAPIVSETLTHLWTYLTSLWETEGACPDPLGAPAPTTEEGPDPDPLGAPTTDAGPDLDPLGR